MVKQKDLEKVGEVNLNDFKTEFYVTNLVRKFLNKKKIALACLLPGGWFWYEADLFDIIDEDEDGIPDKKFGTQFKVIYFGILTKRGFKEGKLKEYGYEDFLKDDLSKKNEISHGALSLSPEPPENNFLIKYRIFKIK